MLSSSSNSPNSERIVQGGNKKQAILLSMSDVVYKSHSATQMNQGPTSEMVVREVTN